MGLKIPDLDVSGCANSAIGRTLIKGEELESDVYANGNLA